jgi:putative transposase
MPRSGEEFLHFPVREAVAEIPTNGANNDLGFKLPPLEQPWLPLHSCLSGYHQIFATQPYFRSWKNAGVWTCIQRAIYEQARAQVGRPACPSVVIMDGQSVKITERGGIRGFDGHKCVKGRKRHILVDTLGLLIASRVEPANVSDRGAGERLLAGLSPLFPRIQTVIADAGHESRKLASRLLRDAGWKLQIVKRGQRAFKITCLTWIVERSFAWLGRNRLTSTTCKRRKRCSISQPFG